MPLAHAQNATEPNADAGPAVTNLLWTGGWDSTFRLLVLVLLHRQTVQPFYLVDPYRPSTLHEVRAMALIRKALERYAPDQVGTLLPTRIYSTEDLTRSAEIRERYDLLKREWNLGAQYEWLALFVDRYDVRDLELSVHSDDKFGFVRGVAERFETARTGEYWKIREHDVPPEIALFRPFTFPMLGWSKVRMRQVARENGFEDILEQTWFCHKPIHGKPCGLCAPCTFVLDEGMGHRIPRAAKMRHTLSPLYGVGRQTRRWVARRLPLR